MGMLKAKGISALALFFAMPLSAYAQTSTDYVPKDVDSVYNWLADGKISGYERTLYYSSHNAFFNKNQNQDTISYGGGLEYDTARLYGFSAGVSGYLQRGIDHSKNPSRVDGYLGPNLSAMGKAYLRWQYKLFTVTGGNQALDMPFASTYDWRMAPQLFQGVSSSYGDANNFISVAWIDRYKSYISNSFTKYTNYNTNLDAYGPAHMERTSGFSGVGGQHQLIISPITATGQAWYFHYNDYAKLEYLQGDFVYTKASWQPLFGVQGFHETGDGKDLAGHVDSQVYGAQFGTTHNSLTLTAGYDYITPHRNAYLNGSLVTPYAHNVASGPLYAQPFLTSTQDLGSGNAYAINVNGSPYKGWFVGARYSYMDLKPKYDVASISQSEYLGYFIYKFSGRLSGVSLSDFVAVQSQPSKPQFFQNRLEFEYDF